MLYTAQISNVANVTYFRHLTFNYSAVLFSLFLYICFITYKLLYCYLIFLLICRREEKYNRGEAGQTDLPSHLKSMASTMCLSDISVKFHRIIDSLLLCLFQSFPLLLSSSFLFLHLSSHFIILRLVCLCFRPSLVPSGLAFLEVMHYTVIFDIESAQY